MKKVRRKLNVKKLIFVIVLIVLVFFLVIYGIVTLTSKDNNKENYVSNEVKMILLNDLAEVNEFSTENELQLNITYEYNDEIIKDRVISQSIKPNTKINKGDVLDVIISLGKLDKEQLASDKINELGKVPIMMYHGIVNKKSSETSYTGGNVDKDGYNRTAEAFREDLEFYYQNGYRMMRLSDYIDGKIDVEYGKSPIILTFDDGNENNLKVTGLDENGNIVIDENSAVGILESFKKKYPDYNITATFFVNGGLFNQPEYNEKIINWLVDNGYDVGNHTQNHLDIKKSSSDQVNKEIVMVYDKLEEIIPGKYVNIIALPFGSPYVKLMIILNMF